MKIKITYSSVVAAVILSAIISLPLISRYRSKDSSFAFEVSLQSTTYGNMQIFYDIGKGFNESDSYHVSIRQINTPVVYRLQLPQGDYRALRFDPIDHEATIIFSDAKIVNFSGKIIKNFSASQFKAAQQIDVFKNTNEIVHLTTVANATDPILELSLDGRFSLQQASILQTAINIRQKIFFGFVLSLALIILLEALYNHRREQIVVFGYHLLGWASVRPKISIAIVAIVSVMLSCFPIIFLGKSYVSPNTGPILLYDSMPTLPGYDDASILDVYGSDVGALMWQHVPYSIVQSSAVFNYYELPLWNRYNSGGTTLIGQGQSMIGDPLNMLVVLFKGASWAWDSKYILAKILFALGSGLTIYAATGHLPSSLILTFSSVFIGFFTFRFNHPASISLCYAPWILFCWFKVVQSSNIKISSLWMGGLMLTNWAVMNSGTVKEAYMLLISLNLTGFMMFLLVKDEHQLKWKKINRLIWSGLLFVLISAPIWMTFLNALKNAYTLSDAPVAQQIMPGFIIGLFDNLFYRQIHGTVFAPSVNFMIFLFVLWSLTHLRDLMLNRAYLSIGLSALLSVFLAFGVIPSSLIVRIPFLANVIHIFNSFSCVLVILLTVMAGFGLKACWERFEEKEWTTDFFYVSLMLFALLALYYGTYNFQVTNGVISYFVFYVILLVSATLSFPFIMRHMHNHRVSLVTLLVTCGGILLMHGQYGMYSGKFPEQVMHPGVRVNLVPKSPAINYIQSAFREPFRTVGFGENLFPGYNAALGIESVSGPDALTNPYYRELVRSAAFESSWDWRYIIREKTLPELKPFYDLLNIKYYLATKEGFPKKLYGLKHVSSFDLNIYQSDSVWPRAFFTDALSFYEKPAQLANMINNGDGRPFAAIQRNQPVPNTDIIQLPVDHNKRAVVFAQNYKLTNNTTSFTVEAPSKGVIVLTESYLNNDFQLLVNQEPWQYFRVNHAFKGLLVDKPGMYVVTYNYWPKYLTLSLLLSGIGLCLMLIWMAFNSMPYIMIIKRGGRSL